MELEHGNRASQPGATRTDAAGVPGKRTLTEALPGAAMAGRGLARGPSGFPAQVQRKQDPSASGSGPAQSDARGSVINHLLESFQNIDVEVPLPDVNAPDWFV